MKPISCSGPGAVKRKTFGKVRHVQRYQASWAYAQPPESAGKLFHLVDKAA